MMRRRDFVIGAGAAAFASPALVRAQEPTVIKMGALKLIHSIAPYFYDRFTPVGYKVEVIPFESPTEGKNAVVTKSVDFGMFGIAAATLGAAAGEPIVVIASACNRGMAVIAKKDSPIASIKDLRGKRVAIWPGSTQEVFILERLRMEGMSIKDISPVRVSFSEMHLALARGDVDAYVGAEPGPGVSLSTGVGQLVEYPYGTAMGSLNMVFGAHRDTLAQNPDLTKVILSIHRQASEYAMKHSDQMAAMAVAKLGQKKEAIEASVSNVELTWRFGATEIGQAKAYAGHMLELKQIKQLPDFAAFFDTRFVDALAKQA
jgi:NitT/TauT family transport system substrate-binding protein